MNEARAKDIRAVEQRAALQQRRNRAGQVRDRFGRNIHEGDGIFLSQTAPMEVIWRVVKATPATEPQYPGAVWLDVVSTTRVLCAAIAPNDTVVLVQPQLEPAPEPDEGTRPPGPAVSPGGIILSDPDPRD